MKIFILIFLVGLSPSVKSINIECVFRIVQHNSERFYSCVFQLFTSEPDVNVTLITGTHSSGKSNNDVKGISASSSNVTTLPKGFESFFNNLEIVQFPKANIGSLKRSDLSGFPNLRVLNLEGNQLIMLKTFLFDDNRKLENIYLGGNKINFVAENLLKPHSKLRLVDLSGNVCISMKADNIRTMQAIKNEMNVKCVDYFELFDLKMSPLAKNLDEAERKNSDLLQAVANLTEEMSEKNKKQEEKIQELRKNLESEISKLESMTNFNSQLEKEISDLRTQLDENVKNFNEMTTPPNDTEDLDHLNSNFTELIETFLALINKTDENAMKTDENSRKIDENAMKTDENSRKTDENSMKIDEIANELTLTEKNSTGKLSELDKNIEKLLQKDEEKSVELSSLQQRINDSLVPEASEARKSDETSTTNYQIYILPFLCILFTISTLVFLFTTVSGRRRKAYLTHEIDMQGFADAM